MKTTLSLSLLALFTHASLNEVYAQAEEELLQAGEELDFSHPYNDFNFEVMILNLEKSQNPGAGYFTIDPMVELNDVERLLLKIHPAALSQSRTFPATSTAQGNPPISCELRYGLGHNEVLKKDVAYMFLNLGPNPPALMNESSVNSCYQTLQDSLDDAIGPYNFLVVMHAPSKINDSEELQEIIVFPEDIQEVSIKPEQETDFQTAPM